ncbi:hypothetical protein Agub_g12539 [Astrephomene gubernaculifera]|uniref:Macro domain-containing protein n=1 Tax=Astrephomene gubernaculifera TaxID=47775 RepID=A0AAD3HRK6_9CHLO|nr:hypothetical protein Agub_g12539 [Astrephomene gubernaculifera]
MLSLAAKASAACRWPSRPSLLKRQALLVRRLAYVAGTAASHSMAPERVFPIRRGTKLVIKQGDITNEDVDAIVNAANERMLGGGGVDGAIHRAAGPQLVRACAQVPEVEPNVRCPTGEARITPGFNLRARHVIHTVGPIYESAEESAPLLASAYRSSMQLALQQGLASVSFPAISTGVYGYPFEEAAQVALAAVDGALGATGEGAGVREVRFVLFGQRLYDVFVRAAEELCRDRGTEGAEEGKAGEEEGKGGEEGKAGEEGTGAKAEGADEGKEPAREKATDGGDEAAQQKASEL